MEFTLSRNWWVLALRGLLAIAFGVVAFAWPGVVWLTLIYLFAAYAIFDGVFAIVSAVAGHLPGGRWLTLLLEGLIGVAAGVVALAWPGAAELVLLYTIAGWSVATGVFEILAALRLRRHVPGEWALALSGLLSIVFGVAVAFFPGAAADVIAWWVGAYAIAFGVLMLVVAFQLRSWGRRGPASA